MQSGEDALVSELLPKLRLDWLQIYKKFTLFYVGPILWRSVPALLYGYKLKKKWEIFETWFPIFLLSSNTKFRQLEILYRRNDWLMLPKRYQIVYESGETPWESVAFVFIFVIPMIGESMVFQNTIYGFLAIILGFYPIAFYNIIVLTTFEDDSDAAIFSCLDSQGLVYYPEEAIFDFLKMILS